MTLTRTILLGVALAPYAALAGVDAWMHERARRVPRLEQVLHIGAAVLLTCFLVAVFRDSIRPAWWLFAAFTTVVAWDELGFHRHLAARERRVHFASYGGLALFVAAWWLSGSAG